MMETERNEEWKMKDEMEGSVAFLEDSTGGAGFLRGDVMRRAQDFTAGAPG